MNKKTLIFLLPILAMFLSACGKTPLYMKSYSFKNNQWKEDVKPVFVVNIPDTSVYYTVNVSLRTTTDYPYNNFWFFLHAKAPDGEQGSQPIEVKIASPTGEWLGQKTGSLVEHKLNFKHKKFPVKGNYTFTLEQRITDRTAKEIADISLSLIEDKE